MATNLPSKTGYVDVTDYFVGDAFTYTIYSYKEDGIAKDFSALTVTLTIKDAKKTVVTTLTGTVSTSGTQIDFSGTPANMPTQKGNYSYSVKWSDGANDVQTFLVGAFIAKEV